MIYTYDKACTYIWYILCILLVAQDSFSSLKTTQLQVLECTLHHPFLWLCVFLCANENLLSTHFLSEHLVMHITMCTRTGDLSSAGFGVISATVLWAVLTVSECARSARACAKLSTSDASRALLTLLRGELTDWVICSSSWQLGLPSACAGSLRVYDHHLFSEDSSLNAGQ